MMRKVFSRNRTTYSIFLRGLYTILPALLLSSCLPGGGFEKGGHIHNIIITPQATMTRGADYQIICYDFNEIARRKKLEEEGTESFENAAPPIKLISPENYNGSCAMEGESSTFFLFNFIPATPPINPHYAISQAVQKVEGDTMINMRIWHETHYYSIMGRVSVFKVRGDVIRFAAPGASK